MYPNPSVGYSGLRTSRDNNSELFEDTCSMMRVIDLHTCIYVVATLYYYIFVLRCGMCGAAYA